MSTVWKFSGRSKNPQAASPSKMLLVTETGLCCLRACQTKTRDGK